VQLDLTRQLALLNEFELHRKKWDLIVLQSYRDDLKGDNSLYMQFAPKYAELAKEQGARIILYVTTPDTRFFENDPTKDRDGQPITQVFSKKDRTDLQRIAREGYQEYQKLRTHENRPYPPTSDLLHKLVQHFHSNS